MIALSNRRCKRSTVERFIAVCLATSICATNFAQSRPAQVDPSNVSTSTPSSRLEITRGHSDAIWSLRFSPDGSTLATGGTDGTARLWDVESGIALRWFEANEGHVNQVLFPPDGKSLLVAHWNGVVANWDIASGRRAGTVKTHQLVLDAKATERTGRLYGATLSSNGQTMITRSEGDIYFWDVPTGKLQRVIKPTNALASIVAELPAMTPVEVLSGITTPEPNTGLHRYQLDVRSFAVSPDGKVLAAGGDVARITARKDSSDDWAGSGAVICLWDTATGRLLRVLHDAGWHNASLAFSHDGRSLASGGTKLVLNAHQLPGEVRVWDVPTGVLRHTLTGIKGEARAVAFSPDSRYVVGGGIAADVVVWDAASGQVAHSWQEGREQGRETIGREWISSVAFSPRGDLLASASAGGFVRVRRFPSGELYRTLARDDGHDVPVGFTPDSRMLVTRQGWHTVSFWDVRRATLLQSLRLTQHDKDMLSGVMLSPDGKTLAAAVLEQTSDEEGETQSKTTVRLWDIESRQPQEWSVEVPGSLTALAFSHDGLKLAIGSEWNRNSRKNRQSVNRTEVWDTRRGAALWAQEETEARRGGVAFTPDGSMLAGIQTTTRFDASQGGMRMPEQIQTGEVRLWNAETGALEKTLAKQEWIGGTVAFLPDGKTLFTLSSGQIRLWDVKTEVLLQVIPTDGSSAVSLAPDGKSFAITIFPNYSENGEGVISGSTETKVRLRSLRHCRFMIGNDPLELAGASGSVFSPDGQLLASGSKDGMAIWGRRSGRLLATFATIPVTLTDSASETPAWVVFAPNGDYTGSPGVERFLRTRIGELWQPVEAFGRRRAERIQLSLLLPDAVN